MSQWLPIKGDGSDAIFPIGTWFDCVQRDGRVEEQCCVTKFCVGLDPGMFVHTGGRYDIVAVRLREAAA